jgi:hypothetical protein
LLQQRELVAPLGDRTTFCFDADSGALVQRITRRGDVTDSEQLTVSATTVTDADLVLPTVAAG